MKDQCNICFCNILNENYCILKKLVYKDEFGKQTSSDNQKLIYQNSCKEFDIKKSINGSNIICYECIQRSTPEFYNTHILSNYSNVDNIIFNKPIIHLDKYNDDFSYYDYFFRVKRIVT